MLLLVANGSSQLHKMYQNWCTAKNSWWLAESLPETCRVVILIKSEFGASVGFIHKESVTMHGHKILNFRQWKWQDKASAAVTYQVGALWCHACWTQKITSAAACRCKQEAKQHLLDTSAREVAWQPGAWATKLLHGRNVSTYSLHFWVNTVFHYRDVISTFLLIPLPL